MIRRPPNSTLFPSTPLFRPPRLKRPRAGALPPHPEEFGRLRPRPLCRVGGRAGPPHRLGGDPRLHQDRKSTRLNSSHGYISYAVFCLKKKKKQDTSNHSEAR